MLTFHAVLLDNTDDNHSYPNSEENKHHAAFHGIGPHFRLKSILLPLLVDSRQSLSRQ